MAAVSPGVAFGAQSTLGEGDPKPCWLCDAGVHSMGVLEAALKTGSGSLVEGLLPLMSILLMASLTYGTLVSIVEGRNPFDRFKDLAGRMLVVGALMATPAAFGSTIAEWVVSPVISAGTGIAGSLSESSSNAMGVKLEGECKIADPSEVKVTTLAEATKSMGKYACKLHQAGSIGVRMGAYIYEKKPGWWPLFGMVKSAFFALTGLIFMALALFAMLSFGFALVEAIVKLAVVGACAPMIAFAWLFQSTRETAKNALAMLMFSFVYLVMSGIGAVMVAFAIIASFSLGLGLPTTSTPDEIKAGFDRLADGWEDFSTMGPFIKFFFFAVAGYSISGKMMKSTQTIAAEICNFAQGQAGEIASAGQSAVAGFAKTALASAVVLTPVAARMGGAAVGKVVGSVASNQAKGAVKGLAGAASGGGSQSASEALKKFGPQLVK